MIDGSEKRNRQLGFELQNSHVCEKRSKLGANALSFLANCNEASVVIRSKGRVPLLSLGRKNNISIEL